MRRGGNPPVRRPAEARRAAAAALLAVLACLAASAIARPVEAAVSADVQSLRWRRPVLLPAGAHAGWFAIVEDSLLAAVSGPGFTDLRLMDADGRARPIHLEPLARRSVQRSLWLEVPIRWVDSGARRREMTLDLGPDAPTLLSVELTGLSVNTPFQVMGRDSAAGAWVLLPLARDEDRGGTAMTPPAPANRVELGRARRYLRLVTSQGSAAPGADDRLRIMTRQVTWPERQAVGFRVTPGRFIGMSREAWRVTVQLTGPARALTCVDLRCLGEGHALRPIRVEVRLPDGGWRSVSTERSASREAAGGEAAAHDSISFDPVRTTALRLTVSGVDAPNVPLEVLGVRAVPQRWSFQLDQAEPLWVGYGDPFLVTPANPGPSPPSGAEVLAAGLGPVEPNPFRRESGFGLEWLKRHPGVLGGVMVVLLALVVWLALGRRRKPEIR